jgi:hypothetical protein
MVPSRPYLTIAFPTWGVQALEVENKKKVKSVHLELLFVI